jgi:PAS domain S-box-containing protein
MVTKQSNVGQPLVQASLIGEAIDGGPVAVFVADEDMRHLAVNGLGAELLGYTRDEILGLTVEDVSAEEDAAERFRALVASRVRLDGEAGLVAKDGTIVRFHRRAQITSIAGLTAFVWVGWPLDEPASGTTPAPRRRSARARG